MSLYMKMNEDVARQQLYRKKRCHLPVCFRLKSSIFWDITPEPIASQHGVISQKRGSLHNHRCENLKSYTGLDCRNCSCVCCFHHSYLMRYITTFISDCAAMWTIPQQRGTVSQTQISIKHLNSTLINKSYLRVTHA
jgi:hypothetical protein